MIFISIVFWFYITLIITLIIGFDRIPLFTLQKNVKTHHTFTIIVPFRNEAENISAIAKSLEQLNYLQSHFEILWVNDQSTDHSVPLLTEFIIKHKHWKLLDNYRQSNSPKKDAIRTAIQQSNYNWIITTDADCIIPKNWLNAYNQFISSHKVALKMIAGPVAYQGNSSFLHQFQNMDFLSLIGTTIGSFGINRPFMCNGANLCYHKAAFFEVNGYDDNDTISSGDDVFLLEKIHQKSPRQVRYLKSKEGLVTTTPQHHFNTLTNQRIRWASKISHTKSMFSKVIGVIVLITNIIMLGYLVFGFWFLKNTTIPLIVLTLKIIIDYILIQKTSRFVNQKLTRLNYILSSLFYPFFTVYIVGLSLVKKATWKGRKL